MTQSTGTEQDRDHNGLISPAMFFRIAAYDSAMKTVAASLVVGRFPVEALEALRIDGEYEISTGNTHSALGRRSGFVCLPAAD